MAERKFESNIFQQVFGVFRIALKEVFAYRFEISLWAVVSLVMLGAYYMLWSSIYSYSGQTIIRGFTFMELMKYYTISFVISTFVWTNIDRRLGGDIYKGALAIDLVNPIAYFLKFLMHRLGEVGVVFVLQATPVLAAGIYFFGLGIPSSGNFLLFVFSVLIAVAINYSFSFCIGALAFWFKHISALGWIKNVLLLLTGGLIIPITFFPASLQKIFVYLPFQYIFYVPSIIFTGRADFQTSLFFVGVGLVWAILLYALARIMWNEGMKQFTGAGI